MIELRWLTRSLPAGSGLREGKETVLQYREWSPHYVPSKHPPPDWKDVPTEQEPTIAGRMG